MSKLSVLILMSALAMKIVEAEERVLEAEVVVAAPVSEVWAAWTTEEGVNTFFSPAANVDTRPDGAYDILFYPDNPPGSQGAEGMRILAMEPQRRFAFTWNSPPVWPEVRNQRTMVVVRFDSEGDDRTLVRLSHIGWGDGEDWDAAYDYFIGGWGMILKRLAYRFAEGPIDWENVPDDLWYD